MRSMNGPGISLGERQAFNRVSLVIAYSLMILLFCCEDPSNSQIDEQVGGEVSGGTLGESEQGGNAIGGQADHDSQIEQLIGGSDQGTTEGVDHDMDMVEEDMEVTGSDLEVDQCDETTQNCDMAVPINLTLDVLTPLEGEELAPSDRLALSAQLNGDEESFAFVSVSALIDGSIQIPLVVDPANGSISGDIGVSELSVGEHTLEVIARLHPDLIVTQTRSFVIRCELSIDFNEPLDQNIWTLLGDAARHPDGWLDTTDGTPGSRGVIMLSGIPMQVDSLDASFRVQARPAWDWMGRVPESESMSDGFAVTFWNITASDIPNLEEIISHSGSGMGYGVYPIQLQATGYQRPEAFTVEFDTYYNFCRGLAGGWYQDPTDQAHVAISYNGYWHFPHHYTDSNGNLIEIPAGRTGVDEQGNQYSIGCDLILNQGFDITTNPEHPWAPIPQLRDGAWHDVRITVAEGMVSIYFDEQQILSSSAVFSRYKGGILAFSGGSGAAQAYYKFDDLNIVGTCR